MLLAVFSDSHGDYLRMAAVLNRYRPDRVLFLGDVVRDAERVQNMFPDIPFSIVPGNCDYITSYEDSLLLDLEGVRIFAAHGHNHNVKFGLDRFCNSVFCSGSVLGLYGHTHRASWYEERGIQLMNPGSIGDRLHPTFGLVTLENGAAVCRILDFLEQN